VPPSAILAVTFTNKAAGEMRERVASLLEGRSNSRIRRRCFHVPLLLRAPAAARWRAWRHSPRLYAPFSIYDDEDQLAIIKAAYRAWASTRRSHAVSRGAVADQPRQESEETPQEMYKQSADPRVTKLAAVFEEYEKALRQANALDFDDLLLEACACCATTSPRAMPGTAA
jgi:DNA helicase-2/ATP-dependent DNA helicase PcrA